MMAPWLLLGQIGMLLLRMFCANAFRGELARDVHCMFRAIIKERRRREQCLNQDNHELADLGSDFGECMELYTFDD